MENIVVINLWYGVPKNPFLSFEFEVVLILYDTSLSASYLYIFLMIIEYWYLLVQPGFRS